MISIEALTVCVNYSDFFQHVVEANHKLFDKWVVVTDTKDQYTPKLCEEYGLICVQTDAFYRDGAPFNKAAGMNEGLKHISADAWVLFLDADIILPKLASRAFSELDFEKDKIYGIDRVVCMGYDNFLKFKESEGVVHGNWLVHGADLSLGARICQFFGIAGENGKFRGWQPLGFFQLVHRSAFTVLPEGNLKADHYDIEFANSFPRNKRVFIPEILAVHLESEKLYREQDWAGRVSEPFGPVEVVFPERESNSDLPAKVHNFFRDIFQ